MNKLKLDLIVWFSPGFVASSGTANRQTREIRELPEAELWCEDLYFNPALHTRVSDLPYRGYVSLYKGHNLGSSMAFLN